MEQPTPMLALPEILEAVLLSLPPLAVRTVCRQVCKTWKALIEISPVLQGYIMTGIPSPISRYRISPCTTSPEGHTDMLWQKYHVSPLAVDVMALFWKRLMEFDFSHGYSSKIQPLELEEDVEPRFFKYAVEVFRKFQSAAENIVLVYPRPCTFSWSFEFGKSIRGDKGSFYKTISKWAAGENDTLSGRVPLFSDAEDPDHKIDRFNCLAIILRPLIAEVGYMLIWLANSKFQEPATAESISRLRWMENPNPRPFPSPWNVICSSGRLKSKMRDFTLMFDIGEPGPLSIGNLEFEVIEPYGTTILIGGEIRAFYE